MPEETETIEGLSEEVERLTKRKADLLAAEAKLKIPTLDEFQAATPEERVELYKAAPDHAMKLWDKLTEANMEKLTDMKKRQGTYGGA